MLEPYRLAPGERPPGVRETESEPRVHIAGRAHALADRERRLVHELAHDPAEHEPGRVADPLAVHAELREEVLDSCRPLVGGRGQARELGELHVLDRWEQVEAAGGGVAARMEREV